MIRLASTAVGIFLGAEIPAYRPPAKSFPPALTAQEITEPEGILRLNQAQALALMQNPALAAVTWAPL